MPRVKVILNQIECFQTEDLTGADEFYILSVFGKGQIPNFEIKPLMKGIYQLNNGQSVQPNVGLFSEEVGFNQDFVVGMRCYDKDASDDLTDEKLARAAEHAQHMANEAAAVAEEASPNGSESALANFVLALIKGVVSFFWEFIKTIVALDKDDFLGEDTFTLAVPGVPNPTTGEIEIPPAFPRVWPRLFYCLYDGCHYRVTYTVSIGG